MQGDTNRAGRLRGVDFEVHTVCSLESSGPLQIPRHVSARKQGVAWREQGIPRFQDPLPSNQASAPTYTLDIGGSLRIPLQYSRAGSFMNRRAAEGSSLRQVGCGGCMLETVGKFSFLASRIPGFAPDEHRSSTQPNDWGCDEPPQEMRCKNRLSLSRNKTRAFVQASGTSPKGQSFRDQARETMGEQTDFCRRLHTGAFSPWLHITSIGISGSS